MTNEEQRILEVYRMRNENGKDKGSFFVYENPVHVYRVHERLYKTMNLLWRYQYHPLSNLRILDVGCGNGNMLRQFLQWGAKPEYLSGIELRPDAVEMAKLVSPNINTICGSATTLPWDNSTFDLVCQHTVFTSILNSKIKIQIASEMKRVLRPGGAILWYDFMFNNPRNSDVKGINATEIQSLFPGLQIHLLRTTLAPPLARKLPARTISVTYPVLAMLPFLCTHYLGILIAPS